MSAGSDLQILQIELAELRNRVARLELRVQELEGTSAASVPGTPVASRAAVRSSTPGSSSVTSQVGAPQEVEQSWSFRKEVSREIGSFIRRALAGDHRGESGRNKITLGSRLYLIFRDKDSVVSLRPVRVETSFKKVREDCFFAGRPAAEAVFVGIPSQREARIVVEVAGGTWPSHETP